MENQEKELKVEIIDNDSRRKFLKQQELEQQALERRRQKIEIKKAAIKRERKKKKIKIILFRTAIATIIIGGVILGGNKLHSMITDSKNSQEKIMATINKVLDEKEQKEALTLENYEQQSKILEQEMTNLKEECDEELNAEAENTQEKINASISHLADDMLKKLERISCQELTNCTRRTDSGEDYYYDFSLYNKPAVILNWLKSYFEEEQIENVYKDLSDEEINNLILSTSYNHIDQYEDGPNNRRHFITEVADNSSDQSNQEIVEKSKEASETVAFQLAKECLTQKLGYSLDIEAQSVGKGM